MELDRLDRRILAALRANARRSNREIARELGIADSTCHDRVRRLQESGVVTGYHAEVDLERVGRSVQAIIAVRLQPKTRKAVEEFRDMVTGLDDVVAVFVVTGSDDFLVQVAVPTTRALEAFVLDHIARFPHTADVRTSLVYEQQRKPVYVVD
jgi:DNA-binding Lrp family transcriptional regulator